MPSKLIEKLGDGGKSGTFFIARGVGKCLNLYTEESWTRETNKLEKLDLNIQSNLIMVRDFFHDAAEAPLDSADRISLNSAQKEAIEAHDEIVIHTFLRRIEIWSKENYKNRRNLVEDTFGQMRENALVNKPKATDE